MARVIMGANIAGIYGAQIFRADDKPRYRRGFSINIAVLTFGLSLAVLRGVDEWLQRRRKARQAIDESSDDNASHIGRVRGEKVALPSDDLPQPALPSPPANKI